ncbi:zinc finger BED domain-containing protein DAYSLEEPER [Citrus sinensis]|nr:zinc finger BED domain-containing protein DAYSLEEPER [Citrus sinensis]
MILSSNSDGDGERTGTYAKYRGWENGEIGPLPSPPHCHPYPRTHRPQPVSHAAICCLVPIAAICCPHPAATIYPLPAAVICCLDLPTSYCRDLLPRSTAACRVPPSADLLLQASKPKAEASKFQVPTGPTRPEFDGITNMTRHLKGCDTYKTFREQQRGSQQNLTSEGGEENATHFIDSNWCLNRRIISFSAVEDHRGKSIGKKIVACLQDWGIERLFAITTDNATTNDVAIVYVTMHLLAWRNDDALVLAGQYMHVRCCAHILNLIVVSGLGELHISVAAIQNVVKYVRSSTTRLRTFKQCVQQVNGPKGIAVLDCPTKWNSTYLMLMTALKFQAACDVMAKVDKPYEIIFDNDSSMVEQMTKVVNDLLNELCDAYSASSSSSTPSMYNESDLSGSYGGISSSQRFTTEASLVDVEGGEGDDIFSVARPFLGYAKKVNGSKYPILEIIARDVLVVPISTVASESAFSTGCQLIRAQASTVEAVSADMGVMDV